MATSIPILIRQTAGAFRRITPTGGPGLGGVVYKDSGALNGLPHQTKFGFLKAMGIVIPFLWAGASMSKHGAAFLEEHDIFVPSDDDDDF